MKERGREDGRSKGMPRSSRDCGERLDDLDLHPCWVGSFKIEFATGNGAWQIARD